MKKLLIVLMVVISSLTIFGEDLKMSPKLDMGILENGLTYYIYHNQKPEDKASVHLVVGAGSLQEDEDQLGLAHFIEHMAFNGTTNYPENELVRYLQSTGMKFGADLNAHTGFGETVYKLQVPSNSPEELEKAFEILREWATEITFLPQDVEDEKNIILEEWRLRQGLRQRMSDAQRKAVFGESRYAERFPIGDPDIIRNATPELLKRYYEKWYVPENMAIIAVGDFDKKEVEEYINKYFNYKGRRVPKHEKYRLGRGNHEIYTFTDYEITQSMFDIILKDDRKAITTKEEYKNYLVQMLFTGILENRYAWEVKGADPKFREGYSYHFPMGPHDSIHIVGGLLREENMEEGIYELQRYLKTMAYFDVSDTELRGEKANLYKTLEDMKNNRDSMESESFTVELKNLHLEGEIFAEMDYQFEVFTEVIKEIKAEDIRDYARRLYESDNVGYFLTAPKTNGNGESVKVPSKERIGEIIEEVKSEAPVEYELDLDNLELQLPQIEEGKILQVEEEKYNKRYILENGIEVIVKDTPYDKDKISIKFFKDGGSSTLDYDGFLASEFTDVIPASGIGNLDSIGMDIFLKDKNLSVTPYIKDYSHGIDIKTIGRDLETTLAINYLLITDPKIDDTIYKNTIDQEKEEILNRGNSPATLYRDRIKEVASEGHPRRKPMTIEEVDTLTEKRVLDAFKKIYGNMNGSKVVIVGSLKDLPIEELIKKYIASLPSDKTDLSSKDLGIELPEGKIREDVVKGVDKKTAVTLIYPYRKDYVYRDRVLYLASSQILNNIMLEDVREKIGGVYSINSYAVLTPLVKKENYLVIRFTTDPARRDEVTGAVKKSVDKLLKGDYPGRMIKNTVENYRFNYADMLKENDFWMSYLYRREAYGDGFEIMTPEEYRDLVKRDNIEKFVEGAIDDKNYIEINLIPERAE